MIIYTIMGFLIIIRVEYTTNPILIIKTPSCIFFMALKGMCSGFAISASGLPRLLDLGFRVKFRFRV